MPALSFQGEWLDKLLSGSKQQTTRQQTDRIKVGDVVHIYNQQRRRIADKPLRETTWDGYEFISGMIEDIGQYPRPMCDQLGGYSLDLYHAHFLGKVMITEVYDLIPIEMIGDELKAWAVADGFKDFHPTYRLHTKGIHEDDGANMWFQRRYGEAWMHQRWTVIRWQGWQERYFEPDGRKS